jgi:hypothetical protein
MPSGLIKEDNGVRSEGDFSCDLVHSDDASRAPVIRPQRQAFDKPSSQCSFIDGACKDGNSTSAGMPKRWWKDSMLN